MDPKRKPDKTEHDKKIIAPVIITALIAAYYILIAIVFLAFPGIPALIKIPAIIIAAALIGVLFYVLYERINEIRSGEEDDLSKY